MKRLIYYLIFIILFLSGCVTSQPYLYSGYNCNYSQYLNKEDTYHMEDNEEIDYQEMYFEGFGEEQEDLEYE